VAPHENLPDYSGQSPTGHFGGTKMSVAASQFRFSVLCLTAVCVVSSIPCEAPAQQLASTDSAALKLAKAEKKAVKRAENAAPFYSAETPMEMSLTTNMKRIKSDKSDKAPWRPATVSFTDTSGKVVSIPTLIKTRGIWRLKNCELPPLRLNFKSELTKSTMLRGVDKPKLVSACHNDDDYERYVIEEMQLYRIYGLLTPVSHRARLLKMKYTDSASGKVQATGMAIMLEEPEVLAARVSGEVVNLKGALPGDLSTEHDVLTGLFQYMIGNTDWSVYALHNIDLVRAQTGDHMPIPYDFDFSGVINAPYATVDPKLPIMHVRDRLYRGYCHDPQDFQKAFALFNEKKPQIYALYSDSIGSQLPKGTVKETLKYFDDFYETINNPRRAKREILDSCLKP
jgi:hypothetical protein